MAGRAEVLELVLRTKVIAVIRMRDAVKLGRMVVQNCIFPLFEVEHGETYKLTMKPSTKKPIDDYLKLQGRFRHLKPETIKIMQEAVDHEWARLLKLCENR